MLCVLCLTTRRSPLGLRELKQSLHKLSLRLLSRSPLGLRELKLKRLRKWLSSNCRSPLGLRELKLDKGRVSSVLDLSQPAWAA